MRSTSAYTEIALSAPGTCKSALRANADSLMFVTPRNNFFRGFMKHGQESTELGNSEQKWSISNHERERVFIISLTAYPGIFHIHSFRLRHPAVLVRHIKYIPDDDDVLWSRNIHPARAKLDQTHIPCSKPIVRYKNVSLNGMRLIRRINPSWTDPVFLVEKNKTVTWDLHHGSFAASLGEKSQRHGNDITETFNERKRAYNAMW